MATVKTLILHWDGPFTFDDIDKGNHVKTYCDENVNHKEITGKIDFGIYAIYGRHIIYGPDSLLYIGRTKNIFRSRLNSHNETWLNNDSDEVKIYIGRLVELEEKNKIWTSEYNADWDKDIEDAEKLLIYYCSPAYNSSNILSADLDPSENILLHNIGKRAALPYTLSSGYAELLEKSKTGPFKGYFFREYEG